MSTSSASPRTGRCLCGKIEYELQGPSATPLYNTVCHCLNCRRVSGTAFYTASICPKEGFSVTKGAEFQKDYWDTNTDSGTNLKRVFCIECGTKLFAFTALANDIVSVAAGTLDDFDSWRPDTEQYCVHRADFLDKLKSVRNERRFKLSVKGETE